MLEKQRAAAGKSTAGKNKPEAAAAPKGFNKGAATVIPEKEEESTGKKKEREFNNKNYFEGHEAEYQKMFDVIKSLPELQTELERKTFGRAEIDLSALIDNFRKTGSIYDRDRLRAVMYGGYAKFPARIRQDYVLVKFIGAHIAKRMADRGKSVKAHVLDTDYIMYNKDKGYVCRPQMEIEAALKELKVPHKKWQEYFDKGYVNGLVGDLTVRPEVKDKYEKGLISQEEYLSMKNAIGASVAASLNGRPLKFYVNSVFNDIKLLCGVRDQDGKTVGYSFRNGRTVYEFGDKELEMLAQGLDVTLTADGGKSVTVHYSPLDGGVVPSATIGKSLKEAKYVAQELSRAAEQEEQKAEDQKEELSEQESAELGLGND